MCRFSESGGSCWVKLASETQADETLVALDGSLWEGSRLSVRQATAAEDERSGNLEKRSRSQRDQDDGEEEGELSDLEDFTLRTVESLEVDAMLDKFSPIKGQLISE